MRPTIVVNSVDKTVKVINAHKFKPGDHVKLTGGSVCPNRRQAEYAGRTGKVTGYEKDFRDGNWATVVFDKPYTVPARYGGPFDIDDVQVHDSELRRG